MAVSQKIVRRANAVLQEYLRLNPSERGVRVAAFLGNHLSKCAHAFREALTKQTEVILVCNWLDLFYP